MDDLRTDEVIDGLDSVWSSTLEATNGLSPEQWATPTACPGWDVQDQLAHLVGIERSLQGVESPKIELGERGYLKNPIGEMNEQWVEFLRTRSGNDVRDEFATVTAERLASLRSFSEETFDEIGWSPVGQVPMRKFMEIRIMDSWLHEQDIRFALDRPGGRNGIGEAVTIGRVDLALGVVVGKGSGAKEGESVAFEIEGPLGGRRRIEIVEGRAKPMEGPVATCTISMSQETYVRRFGGRISPEVALSAEGTKIVGNATMGAAALRALSVMI